MAEYNGPFTQVEQLRARIAEQAEIIQQRNNICSRYFATIERMQGELKSLTADNQRLRTENDALRARLNWAANELLACDYGDNESGGANIGWIVYGWRNRHQADPKTRIYGATIDAAIDDARGVTADEAGGQ
jgi:uncharacterized coiled-coil protein SlyX